MIRHAAAWVLMAMTGCTSVKMVQREGCWVRRTETWPGRVVEELGPCTAPEAPWSDDRVMRAVQECVARTDHRWQMEAQLAWSRGQPIPPIGADDGVYRACLDEPARALAGDNEQLQRKAKELEARLADLAHERDGLRARADDERAHREASERERLTVNEKLADRLLTTQEKLSERFLHGQDTLAGYLGEAAKKSSQPAVATATSTSRSDGSTQSASTAPAGVASGARTAAALLPRRATAASAGPRSAECAPVASPAAAQPRASAPADEPVRRRAEASVGPPAPSTEPASAPAPDGATGLSAPR